MVSGGIPRAGLSDPVATYPPDYQNRAGYPPNSLCHHERGGSERPSEPVEASGGP